MNTDEFRNVMVRGLLTVFRERGVETTLSVATDRSMAEGDVAFGVDMSADDVSRNIRTAAETIAREIQATGPPKVARCSGQMRGGAFRFSVIWRVT